MAIYQQYGVYPFIIGLLIYGLIKRLKNISVLTKLRLDLVIPILCVLAVPLLFSELRLTLPGHIPWTVNPPPTVEVINKAKVCISDPINQGDKCFFKIGPDLEFELVGVGTPLATAFVNTSSPPHKAYYYIGFSSHDPCIRIYTGEKTIKRLSDNAFILNHNRAWLSPYSARAYDNYYACLDEVNTAINHFNTRQAEEAEEIMFESENLYDNI